MAKPIKETPVLSGNDAKRFMDKMIGCASKKLDLPVKERIKANYDKLQSISQF